MSVRPVVAQFVVVRRAMIDVDADRASVDQGVQTRAVVAPLLEARRIGVTPPDLVVHGLLHRCPLADAGFAAGHVVDDATSLLERSRNVVGRPERCWSRSSPDGHRWPSDQRRRRCRPGAVVRAASATADPRSSSRETTPFSTVTEHDAVAKGSVEAPARTLAARRACGRRGSWPRTDRRARPDGACAASSHELSGPSPPPMSSPVPGAVMLSTSLRWSTSWGIAALVAAPAQRCSPSRPSATTTFVRHSDGSSNSSVASLTRVPSEVTDDFYPIGRVPTRRTAVRSHTRLAPCLPPSLLMASDVPNRWSTARAVASATIDGARSTTASVRSASTRAFPSGPVSP